MTILGGVTVLFLALLFAALSLSTLFAVVVAYLVMLEVYGVDPDSGWALMGCLLFILLPMTVLIVYLFVTKYISFMDNVLLAMGLTG